MNKNKIELLTSIISSIDAPIIIEDKYKCLLQNSVIIDASSGSENFCGHPIWLQELEKKNSPILIIRNIDYIHKEEQNKLIEILKYKKVGTNKLKKNLLIALTVDKMNFENINEEIISLTVQV